MGVAELVHKIRKGAIPELYASWCFQFMERGRSRHERPALEHPNRRSPQADRFLQLTASSWTKQLLLVRHLNLQSVYMLIVSTPLPRECTKWGACELSRVCSDIFSYPILSWRAYLFRYLIVQLTLPGLPSCPLQLHAPRSYRGIVTLTVRREPIYISGAHAQSSHVTTNIIEMLRTKTVIMYKYLK